MLKAKELRIVFTVVAGLTFVHQASAETTEEILAKVDASLTSVQDQMYDGQISLYRDNKVTKTLNFTAKLKGLTMKVIKFTAPGDVKNMTILTTKQGHMYVYLPSYKRVRRVAAHVRNQGFMGTDISPEDMSSASLSVGWTATLERESDKEWILILRPKPGNETIYGKLRVTVLKQYGGVSKLEFINGEGKTVKTQVREEWKTFGPITLPTLFTVSDLQTSSVTKMRLSNCRINQGLTDDSFTKRSIMRVD